jgi:hypothetical protein
MRRYPTAKRIRPCLECAASEAAGVAEAAGDASDFQYEIDQSGSISAVDSVETVVAEATALWIPGRPATFATAGEASWKAAIVAVVPPCQASHRQTGVRLDFQLTGAQQGHHAADLDNLLEPTLSTLVNGLGWFRGSRPNIKAIAATKRYAKPTGLQISLADDVSPPWDPPSVLEQSARFSYPGPLPTSARDPALSDWLVGSGAALLPLWADWPDAELRRRGQPRRHRNGQGQDDDRWTMAVTRRCAGATERQPHRCAIAAQAGSCRATVGRRNRSRLARPVGGQAIDGIREYPPEERRLVGNSTTCTASFCNPQAVHLRTSPIELDALVAVVWTHGEGMPR